MTRAELLVAATVADHFPAGNGTTAWLDQDAVEKVYPEVDPTETREVAVLLQDHPELLSHG